VLRQADIEVETVGNMRAYAGVARLHLPIREDLARQVEFDAPDARAIGGD